MKDPLIKSVRAARWAHAKTPLGQYQKLLAEEARWKRKRTISETKLAAVRLQMQRAAIEALHELAGLDRHHAAQLVKEGGE